jgi:hypothetical protein
MCEYYSILYMFRIEPSTAVQGAYDVCNKDAVRHDLETVISRLYSDHRTERDGPGNYLGGWGLSVEKGKCALQFDQRGAEQQQ